MFYWFKPIDIFIKIVKLKLRFFSTFLLNLRR